VKLGAGKPVPRLEALMDDIPEEKTFRVREFKVLRGADMDWLVCPYFGSRGGTVIDWVEAR